MARGSWAGAWPGGRIWKSADGKITYIIRRKVAGRPYHVSTRCASLTPAMKQWERFQADPEGYSPSGARGDPVVLDADMARDFLRWSRDGKGNSTQWVAKQKRYLAWWSKQIGRRDLRRVTVRDHLRPALDRATSSRQRIETIKAFYGWMRKERHIIATAEDPTYGTLAVPQGRPEQWVTPKIIPRASHDAAWGATTQPWRDMMTVLAGTGWHVTELERFIRSGIVADLPSSASHGHGAFKVLVCPRRKSGEMQRTAVTVEAAEAAIRLRERGTYSQVRFYRAVAAACRAADVPPFSPGRYRHTVATWAIEAGADPAAVAAFLGHKSPATTRRFYATLAVAPKIPTQI
jgi:integrase